MDNLNFDWPLGFGMKSLVEEGPSPRAYITDCAFWCYVDGIWSIQQFRIMQIAPHILFLPRWLVPVKPKLKVI